MMTLKKDDLILFRSLLLYLVDLFMSQKYEVILGMIALMEAIKGASTYSFP
jgi:hypothetical protein